MDDRLRIFMYEEAAGDGDLAVDTLQRAGVLFDYRLVRTEADAAAQVCRFNPHLVIAALKQTGGDGREALRAARAKRPDVPFIIVSETRGEAHAIQALKAGAADYVLKDNLDRLPAAVVCAVKEAEERMTRAARVARLECVRAIQSRISSAVLRIHDARELLLEACKIAVEQGRFPLVWAADLSHSPLRADLVATLGRDKRHFALAARMINEELQETGLVARAVSAGGPAVVDDFLTAEYFALGKSPSEDGYRSAIALPLISGETVTAVIVLYAAEPRYFDGPEVKLLADLASDVSFALDYIAKEKKLAALAYRDPLTGLANRQLLHEHLKQALALAYRLKRVIALVFIDLDHFKSVNDTFGHAAGDRLLKEVATRLDSCTREGDIVARYGGDEFVMVLPNLSGDEAAEPLVERMLNNLSQPIELDGGTINLTCSVGVSLYPRDGVDIATLVMKADSAMYQVKRRGRGAFLFHQDEPRAHLLRRGAA
ncbi:MAG: diguanylate cyclase domain-containing protein [Betaproteobacteria bacterium]